MLCHEPLDLSKALIRCASVTPLDSGALNVLERHLKEMGFTCHRMTFADSETPDVDNLYARLGSVPPNICFAGHTDVVPTGNLNDWSSDPFNPEVRDGILYGRGAADMKCAIAAFVIAARKYKSKIPHGMSGSISLLITGDEEGPAVNGTVKMLEWLKDRGETLDHCLVGEPTSDKKLGDMVKIGRRGSLNAKITTSGTQGHVAYPHLANNPISHLLQFLTKLNNKTWDDGTVYFQPTNLEVTTIDTGNPTTNIIPEKAFARFNIRFNNLHSSQSLREYLEFERIKILTNSAIDINVSGEAFLTKPGKLTKLIAGAIKQISGIKTKFSTTGGTSDARFIKNVCPVAEFGMLNRTAHKIDENVKVEDIFKLTDIYSVFLDDYFKKT